MEPINPMEQQMAQQLTDWHRQTAAGIAAAHPLTPTTPIRATGQHLAAENDEPEPTIMDLAGEMQSLADKIKAQRADTGTAWPKAFQKAQQQLQGRIPAPRYERACTLCGGTSTGESHRGFTGRCTCEVTS